METLTLSPEIIAYAKKEIDLKSCMVAADKVTASHILFNQFIKKTKWKRLPKVIFYIVLGQEFGGLDGQDENGLLGYKLKFIE